MKKIVIAMIAIIATTSSSFADTTTMQVSTVAEPTCIVYADNISFGNIVFTTFSNVITTNGTLNFRCSNNTAVTINLSYGNAPTLTAGPTRYMLGTNNNSDKLYYGIFRPVGFGPGNQGPGQWASDSGGPFSNVITTADGTLQQLPMLTRLNTNQIVTPDNYSDKIIITLVY